MGRHFLAHNPNPTPSKDGQVVDFVGAHAPYAHSLATTRPEHPRHPLEHPGRTWASATHRAFSFACVGAAMANETWKFVLAKSKQAMKQVLGIKDEAARMKVTPPLAVAPLVHGDDMRWNPNDDGINFNP